MAGLLGAWAMGWLDAVLEPERAREWLLAAGPVGGALYVVAFSTLVPVGIPGAVFLLPAPLVWPLHQAFLLAWAGATGAGVVGWALGRFLARDFVMARLPERLRHLDQRVGERELTTVILVRLAFFVAAPTHWALGVANVRLVPLLVGTAAGMAPWVAVWMVGGRALLEILQRRPELLLGLVPVLLVAGYLIHRRRRRKARAGD